MKQRVQRRRRVTRLAGVALAAVVAVALTVGARPGTAHAVDPVAVPAPQVDQTVPAAPTSESAVLAGGGFWNVQDVFSHVKGVSRAESGYAGGEPETASFERVNMGMTGHAQAVRVFYDPTQVTFGQLLRVFFAVAHDPTQLDRQGPDQGTQYRSVIFPRTGEQQKVAQAYLAQLTAAKVFPAPIVTVVTPGAQFYPAEGYQQDYAVNHPTNPYIVANAVPKVNQLSASFPELYREEPALVLGVPAPAPTPR